MSHIQYTICRSGSYYYNRRVPKHAVQSYGQFIRCILSSDIHEAKAYAERLGDVAECPMDMIDQIGDRGNHRDWVWKGI